MKAGIFCVAAGAAVALAQPHNIHHRHPKRAVVTETDVAIVTATAPNVVVYVDSNGNPVSTSTEGAAAVAAATAAASSAAGAVQNWASHGRPGHSYSWGQPEASSSAQQSTAPVAASTYVPSEAPASSATSVYVAPTTSTTVAAAPTTTAQASSAAPAKSSTASSAAAASSSASSSSGTAGYGMVYSPYNSDSSCKTQSQVNTDFENISGYGMIRIYGTDCNQVSTVMSAAAAKGMKLFAGVYDITAVTSEINTIISAAKGNWAAIDTISIGNEGVNNGQYTVSAVVDAIGTARTLLKAAGYTGRVVTVDTAGAITANPALCKASDFAAANCHAFFNGAISAAQTGEYVVSQAQAVSAACGGMDTMITESGYPWQGQTNGLQVPSVDNQKTAIASLKASFNNNIILFTAYNDLWKVDNSGTFGAEKYWGMLGNAPA